METTRKLVSAGRRNATASGKGRVPAVMPPLDGPNGNPGIGAFDGDGLGDHDQPYRFGFRPRANAPYPFNTRQLPGRSCSAAASTITWARVWNWSIVAVRKYGVRPAAYPRKATTANKCRLRSRVPQFSQQRPTKPGKPCAQGNPDGVRCPWGLNPPRLAAFQEAEAIAPTTARMSATPRCSASELALRVSYTTASHRPCTPSP